MPVWSQDMAIKQEGRPAATAQRTASLGNVLGYLESMTFDFERDGHRVSAVRIYNEPSSDPEGDYASVVARESGFEGVACLDDTARAALLALEVYERTHSPTALSLAQRWLSFVEYMQYPDGEFANFIRTNSGVRNATGQTSIKGGYWWSVRALRALACAYRVTGNPEYLERYLRCELAPLQDGKIEAVRALAEMDLYRAAPSDELKASIVRRCMFIAGTVGTQYFLDQPGNPVVSLWGYHQLHAVASAATMFGDVSLLSACRRSIETLIEPDVRASFWHSFPSRQRNGVCAYDVAPIVQGLGAMYAATGAQKYRRLALQGAQWLYGRNEAHAQMYDPTTGRCRDGITDGQPSDNFGAESAIEAGFIELARNDLLDRP